jgi:hypothetical protein
LLVGSIFGGQRATMRRMRAQRKRLPRSGLTAAVVTAAIGIGLAGVISVPAGAHSSGCHGAHSCPSDHHTYVWYDSGGQGWDCVKPGAPEYDPSQDTSTISSGGYTYYCRAAGSIPVSQPPGYVPPNLIPPDTPPSDTTPSSTPSCRLARLPDPSCTPGAVFAVTASKVCERGYARRVRRVSESTKKRVYAEYGVMTHRPGQYEIDHLVPLSVGGSNAVSNLWPEAASPRPGFHEKDALENALHARVCSGRMTLSKAQRLFRDDWYAAYRSYVRH